MKIYPHFSVVGFCNTYIVAPDEPGQAVIVDPGHMDTALLDILVKGKWTVGSILLTHSHPSHCQGLGTLLKIYADAKVYAASDNLGIPSLLVQDGKPFNASGFSVMPMHVPGHSLDSMVYLLGKAMFTGDTLESGTIGGTAGYLEQELLCASIESKLFPLDGNCLIFPGHGPISKLRIEQLFNQEMSQMGAVVRTRKYWSGAS